MNSRDAATFNRLVVIGASVGGIDALRTVLSGLDEDLDAPVCIVVHISPASPGLMHEILGRASRLPVVPAADRAPLKPGHVYVAIPDRHLLVEPGRIRVTKGPRENRFRPAIDPLFRSAAQVYGPGAIGVILTGNLDDGAAGLRAIARMSGTAIVQEPSDALCPSMPAQALVHVPSAQRARLPDIASLITAAVASNPEGPDIPRERAVPDELDIEVNIAKAQNPVDAGMERLGDPSSYSCPDCHGVLLALDDAGHVRFRCHTGHAYSLESLIAAIDEEMERAMWNAVRALEEGGLLMTRLAQHLASAHDRYDADPLRARGDAARRASAVIGDLSRMRPPLARGPRAHDAA